MASTNKPAPDNAARAALAALRHLRPADLRGVARLATQATTGVTGITEGVHQSVLSTMGLPGGSEAGRARGLTGLVYQGIRGVTRLVDVSLQAALLRLEPFLERRGTSTAPSPDREAVLAALHPGTVDSALSAPFRGAQIGRPAPDAARDLLAVLDTLQPADSGGFWAYDGQRLPW